MLSVCLDLDAFDSVVDSDVGGRNLFCFKILKCVKMSMFSNEMSLFLTVLFRKDAPFIFGYFHIRFCVGREYVIRISSKCNVRRGTRFGSGVYKTFCPSSSYAHSIIWIK